MCTYTRTIFSCNHQVYGSKVEACMLNRAFSTGLTNRDCAYKQPHVQETTRFGHRCEKCVRIEWIKTFTREELEKAREELSKLKEGGTKQEIDDGDQVEEEKGEAEKQVEVEDCPALEAEILEASKEVEGQEDDQDIELEAQVKKSEIEEPVEATKPAPKPGLSQLKPPSQLKKPAATGLPLPKTKKPQEPAAPAVKTPPKSRMPVPKSRNAAPVTVKPAANVSKLPRFGARK